MTINKWAFFWGLAAYLILSGINFYYIPSGYTLIFLLIFFIPGSIITLIACFIINIIGSPAKYDIPPILVRHKPFIHKKINIRPNISFILIWFLILFQILFTLFSYETCSTIGFKAGLEGGYFAYEKLLGNNSLDYCGTGVDNIYIVKELFLYVVYCYITTLLLIISRAYYLAFKNRNKDELNNKIPKTKILIGIGSLIILTSLILFSSFVISNTESNTDQVLRSEPFNLHHAIRDIYFESGDYNSLTTQKDGKIIVGGTFSTYKGSVANRIIRLNTDGSVDTSFDIGTGFDNAVQTVVIQEDGKILVGGTFSTYKGSVANRIIRLNTDGSIDNSFNVGNGFNNKYAYINTIATQKDGKIIVGGNFGEYKGVSANRILRFNTDGSRDKTFISKANFDSPIYHIKIQNDGKILVAGGFEDKDYAQYSVGQRVVRLNSDGGLDNSFTSQDGFQDDASSDTVNVKFITEQSDGKIILVGDFDSYKGVPANGIIRINPDGSIDKSFNPQIQYKYNIRTMAIQSDGRILIGGSFDIYSRDFSSSRIPTAKGVIRLNSDGTKDDSFSKGDGFEENVRSMAVQSDGKIIVVGDFDSYQGITAKGIARLNSDGSWDDSFITNK
jgi:uncharacterized delta-60 repeat protein